MKEFLEAIPKEGPAKRNGTNRERDNEISIYPLINPDSSAKRSFSFSAHWRAIRTHLWMIAGVTILGTLLAAGYVARQPDVYEARARVQVDQENNPAVGISGKNTASSIGTVNDPTYFSTQLQIAAGSGLLRRVAKTLDLEHNRDFLQTQKVSSWRSLLRMAGWRAQEQAVQPKQPIDDLPLSTTSVSGPSGSEDLEEARRLAPYVSKLQSGLIAEPVKDARVAVRETRLIDIRFSHHDPKIAAKVPNAIASALILSNLEKRTETSAFAGDFLQKRIAELQAQIRSDEERLLNYGREHEILSLEPSQNTVVSRLVGLNNQLLGAENERKAAEAAYRTALAPGAADALVEGKTSAARSSVYALRQKRAELLTETTEEWPEVKEIDKQIAELEKQINEENDRQVGVAVTNLQTKYRQALANEEALRKAFKQQRVETLTQNEAAVNYKIIQQGIDTGKTLLDGLLQRSKENDVILAAIPNNIHITDYAQTPDRPVAQKRFQVVSLAFVCSLSVGICLALVMGQLDDGVYSLDQLEGLLNIPVLATVPPMANLHSRFSLSLTALQRNGNRNGSAALLSNASVCSPFSEAYRKLRTLLLKTADGKPPKTVLITSSIPSEGKTTTAINTAMALASAGLRVLIIDADLRHPSHHSIFALDNETGLSTILSVESTGEAIFDSIALLPESGVSVLTAGPQLNNPSDLMGSEEMNRLITTLSASFDHIIIDTSPITYFSDSILLASVVDGVVLVVCGGTTSAKMISRAQKELQEVGANILGIVLNKVKTSQQDYYSYYKDSYYKAS